jgi:low affinity Fe/Cu permease
MTNRPQSRVLGAADALVGALVSMAILAATCTLFGWQVTWAHMALAWAAWATLRGWRRP